MTQATSKLGAIVVFAYNQIPQGWLLREIGSWIITPFVALFATPVRLVQALWNCRVLARGEWRAYNRFTFLQAMNSLFYRVQAINLSRYGRKGVSPLVGLGNYPLSKWFFVTQASLYAYSRAGAVVPLAGMVCWWAAHIFWAQQAGWEMTAMVMAVIVLGTGFYTNTFFLQNYNALGWAFLPVALYGLATGQWMVAGLAWIGISFTSFTALLVGGAICMVYAVAGGTPWPILSIVPAVLKIGTHFLPGATGGSVMSILGPVGKGIGLFRKDVRYHYANTSKFQLWHGYHLLLHAQFVAVYTLQTGGPPVMFLTITGLFIINARIARFADIQSILMAAFSTAAAETLLAGDPLLLVPLWLVCCPALRMIGLQNYGGFLGVVPKASPYRIDGLVAAGHEFLKPVADGQRVFMAFDPPKDGVWEQLFNGQARLLELPHFVAAERSIHFMPDYWAVYETNKPDADDLWGRDAETVTQNVRKFAADFAIVHQPEGMELGKEWQAAGYEPISRFPWRGLVPDKDLLTIFPDGQAPEWRLLRVPQDSRTP